jgi:Na+/proline symporter
MLLWFVIIYWIISVAIGLWAALRVKNTGDFAIAGRALPLYIVTATVFATWFGSETVLGIPAKFINSGMGAIVADPFGASLCLVLVGLFFARPLYRMNLLTIGDFYRNKYGRAVEALTTLFIVVSYLGWVGAQISALGLVFNVVSDGAMSQTLGKIVGASTVLVYTIWGGMWSVAITDFLQMIIIVIGMLYIGWDVSGHVPGGVSAVVAHAEQAGKFANFWPEINIAAVLTFVGALVTMMLGSIPQQDVFQRVASARDEKTAGRASVLGGCMYFAFAFIPMFLGYSATLIDPDLVSKYISDDKQAQLILPHLVLQHAPLFAQIMFFGALLSAIKSCASATLLAPSVTFTENILRPTFKHLSDRQLLRLMRVVVLCFTVMVTVFSIWSDLPIYNMVENAYSVTLVGAFVPLAFGLYWKRSNTQGALLSIFLGVAVWVGWPKGAEEFCPGNLAGLFASLAGMLVGSMMSELVGAKSREAPHPAHGPAVHPHGDAHGHSHGVHPQEQHQHKS